MKIADIELGVKELLVARMVDVTEASFRFMC